MPEVRVLPACLALIAILCSAPHAGAQPAVQAGDLRAALTHARGEERLQVLTQLSELLRASGSDEAVQVALEARALGRELRKPDAETRALIDLALARRARGEYALALVAGHDALRLARASGNRPLEAGAHNVLGLIENSRDEPAAALAHALDELRLVESTGERQALSHSLNNVGNSYRRLGEYTEALAHHRRSLAIKQEIGDRDGAGFSHHNIGEVLAEQGAHEEALASYARAETEWRAVGNRRALAAALKSEGVALAALGRFDQAVDRLEDSLALRRDPPNLHGEADTLLSLSRVQMILRRPGEAAQNARRALSLAETLDQTTLISDALTSLAAAEAAAGNVRAAGELIEKQIALQHRLRAQERSRVRSEMRAMLEAREAQHRAETLEREAERHEAVVHKGAAERNLALITSVLLLAITGVAVNRFRIKRKSEQRLRRQTEALELALGQVKTLRGLLPLCGWCHRKVRDSSGQWGPLEAYVKEHTDAQVTHGICPECREAHFPTPGER